jgi:hypothetical protein
MKTANKLWLGLGILILFSPVGLLLPKYYKSGDAWGEWGMDTIKELTGHIPSGIERFSAFWNAPFPEYNLKGWEEKGLNHAGFAYIISATVGALLTVAVVFLIGRLLIRKSE